MKPILKAQREISLNKNLGLKLFKTVSLYFISYTTLALGLIWKMIKHNNTETNRQRITFITSVFLTDTLQHHSPVVVKGVFVDRPPLLTSLVIHVVHRCYFHVSRLYGRHLSNIRTFLLIKI